LPFAATTIAKKKLLAAEYATDRSTEKRGADGPFRRDLMKHNAIQEPEQILRTTQRCNRTSSSPTILGAPLSVREKLRRDVRLPKLIPAIAYGGAPPVASPFHL
jgi:hypothetical protein